MVSRAGAKAIRAAALLVLLTGAAASAAADWQDLLKRQRLPSTGRESGSSASLSEAEVAAGLKQALEKGVGFAVNRLGKPGRFLDNPQVRIPMPSSMNWAAKSLRTMGQGHLVDEFEQSMNRAEERAVPAAGEVFTDAVRKMSVQDARAILNGPDDAATRYLRRVGGDRLAARVRPIVSETTEAVGVTQRYRALTASAGGLGGLIKPKSLDLDTYVTSKTLDGVFLMIAKEEKRIRENPIGRTTELLQKVFGAAR